MADTSYDGQFGVPVSFTFTPTSGTPFGSAQAQAEELDPHDLAIETPKFTPISGANAGNEQFVLGKIPTGQVQVKATYADSEHAAAQTCLVAKVKGVLVVQYGPGPGQTVGPTDTYAEAALIGIKGGPIDASNLRTDMLTFIVALPSAFVAGH